MSNRDNCLRIRALEDLLALLFQIACTFIHIFAETLTAFDLFDFARGAIEVIANAVSACESNHLEGLFFLLGGYYGALSVNMFPHLMIHFWGLRLASYIIIPFTIGRGFFRWAVTLLKRGRPVLPQQYFWCGFLFVFSLLMVRAILVGSAVSLQ